MNAVVTTTRPSASRNRDTVALCRGVLKHHAKSFSAASVFLSSKKRDQAAVIYAFCRAVDDAVDEARSREQAEAELTNLELMLDGVKAATPIVAAYVELCDELGVGLSPARDLILGARSDLHLVRMWSDSEFLVYCYRVAGTVGKMMCGVLGVTDPEAEQHAIDLGIAMQITNICRDVLEDAQMGRVYLPQTRLRRVGLRHEDVLEAVGVEPRHLSDTVRRGVAMTVADLLDMAETYYQSGADGFGYIPARPRLAIVAAASLYREIGETLRKRDHDPLLGRVRVSKIKKWALMAQSAMSWCFGILRPPHSRQSTDARLLASSRLAK